MTSLILKIFLCYWIAAGIVIALVDYRPHEQMHRAEVTGALTAALELHARNVISAFQSGGCAAARPLLAGPGEQMDLAAPDGSILCGAPPAGDVQSLVHKAQANAVPIALNLRSLRLVALAVRSPAGQPFVLILQTAYGAPLSPYGIRPGPTTVYISGVVTLLLAILVAVPIRRLRSAAREIAQGKLQTRVSLGVWSRRLLRIGRDDVVYGLIEDFNNMAERLDSLVDAQRVLFRDVSHELRSPLARLSVALELAREAGDPSMRAPLDRIEEEAARVNELIGQILSLSYMETLQEITQPASLSLTDLVSCILPDIQYEAAARRCQVTSRVLQEAQIVGDAELLHRAIENVVRNAIRYSPDGGIVEMCLDTALRDGAWLAVLRIADSGPGVPSDELPSILRPFYRVDKSRQRSTGGFGVGLAIADRAVKLHAGEIVASNRPEGGFLVEMSFPLAEGA
jgi:signal transduction histidine kinase